MGNLVSGGQSQGPFHSCLPSRNSKKNRNVERGIGPIVHGGAQGSSVWGFRVWWLMHGEAAPAFVCSGPRENHPSPVQLFHMSAMAAAVFLPLWGTGGHWPSSAWLEYRLYGDINMSSMVEALESLWERRSLHCKPPCLSLLHLKLGADGNCGLIKTYKSVICSASTVTF